MKNLLFFITFLFTLSCFSQYQITIEAFVIDEKTKAPLPYVNIGFAQKGIGTVSNEQGYFILKYDEESVWEKELLQFSVLGYETFNVEAKELFNLLSNSNKIYLKPKAISLDETIITAIATEEKRIGTSLSTKGTLGYWKDELALGGEIATRLRVKKKDTRLKDLQLKILENLSDSLRLRINIYDYDKRGPINNILNTNIFHTVTLKEGIETIDLRPYKIKVNKDIIVSIEVVEVFGKQIGFVVGGLKKIGLSSFKSYTRYISQDKWKRIDNVAMNFTLLTSYPTANKDVFADRNQPQRITLFWDSSKSMTSQRNLEKELEFIEQYLKAIKNTSVKVVKFSANINSTKDFVIESGQSNELITFLKDTNYDGATDYSKLSLSNAFNPQSILLFTDGEATLGNLNLEADVPVFAVSTSNNSKHSVLQDVSMYSDGHYINLYKNAVDNGLNFILKEIEDTEVYDSNEDSTKAMNNIYGRVYDSIYPIKGASIRVENTFIETVSEADGSYSIPAGFSDVLIVNHLGMTPKRVVVSGKKNIDINLEFDGVLLDEVSITTYANRSEEIKEVFRGDVTNAGGAAILMSKDIRPSDLFIGDILRRVPGVLVQGARESPTISVRGNASTPLFLLDGGLIGDINLIDPQSIAGIAVLKSLADTNRYGAEGAAGVIIIRTKMEFTPKDADGNIINSALVTGNNYDENLPLINTSNPSDIVNYLKNAKSLKEGLNLYQTKTKQGEILSIPFYLESSEYFMKWDKEVAYNILTNVADVAYDNAKALKVLAYKLEELGKLKEAKHIYERLVELRPKDAQSYRDLALIYQNTGAYEEAMTLYKQMLANAIEDVDFSGLQKTIINELRHLLAYNKSQVSFQDLPTVLLNADFKQDIRMVFEWNNSSTEFDIQFVGPNKKYFTWQHTILDNKDRLLDEIEKGYFTEEFSIDDSPQGEWIINVQCLNEEPPLNPTFLKYTVYKNFGLKNQTKTVRVIKLFGLQKKVTIDKFTYSKD